VVGGQHSILPRTASHDIEPIFGRTAGIGPFDAAILRTRAARALPELSVLFGIYMVG
jgi:hypothetical protein